jgi:hypothetical protein
MLAAEVLPIPANCPDCGLGRAVTAMFIAGALMLLGLLAPILRRDRWKSILLCNVLSPILVFNLGIKVPRGICWEYGNAESLSILRPSWDHSPAYRTYHGFGLSLRCSESSWRFQ